MSPAWTAFLGSLILSLIAVLMSDGPNRDGMLYLENARVFLEGGFEPALTHFNWPFLAVAIGVVSKVTGLGVETAAHLLCGLLLAGACALLVLMSERLFPDTAWAACLVALALPAFNAYRDYLIREFGFWLFSLLAILLALRWAEKPAWGRALGLHLAVAAASLFRLEAVALYPALFIWQSFEAGGRDRWRRFGMLGSAPLAAMLALALILLVAGKNGIGLRIQYFLESLDPWVAYEGFRAAAERMHAAIQGENSLNETAAILFIGLLSTIPVKFLQMSGVFVVPLAVAFYRTPARTLLARMQPITWLFPIYCLVLMVFVLHQFFLVGRHASFLNMLAVPLIAAGLAQMLRLHLRWRVPLLAIIVASALSNVVSFGPGKEQYVKAGAWLAANAPDRSRVYAGSDRSAYYAGWPYAEARSRAMSREALTEAVRAGRFDLIVLDSQHKKNAWLPAWVSAAGVVEVIRFSNGRGDAVIVFRPIRQ